MQTSKCAWRGLREAEVKVCMQGQSVHAGSKCACRGQKCACKDCHDKFGPPWSPGPNYENGPPLTNLVLQAKVVRKCPCA